MSKRDPPFSPLSCGLTLILMLSLAAVLLAAGAQMFNPGPLTAVHPQNRPLQGFTSHAGFENECDRCHTPWQGPTAGRCLACHVTVAAQIKTESGLHGVLADVDACLSCHSDHAGRQARLIPLNLPDFPHLAATGFSLARHQTNYNGLAFQCADCHPPPGYDFNPAVCSECHARAEAAFMAEHRAGFGDDCLTCHNGEQVTAFDHAVFFPLEGSHAAVPCLDCHLERRFKGTPGDCYGCHATDDIHTGQFGSDCSACHTPAAWSQTTLEQHLFPVTHKNEGRLIACQVCHPAVYTAYTCYGCHKHDPLKTERHHLEKGIRDFQDCAACHPTGGKPEGNDHDEEAGGD